MPYIDPFIDLPAMNNEMHYESLFSDFMIATLIMQTKIENMTRENSDLKDKLR